MNGHGLRYREEQIVEALKELAMNGGNLSRTSAELGIARSTLVRWRDHHPAIYATACDRAGDWIDRLLRAEYDAFLLEERKRRIALEALKRNHH